MARIPVIAHPQQGRAAEAARTRSQQRLRLRTERENIAGYLFLLPWFGGLILLTAGPVIGSLYLSFTKFDLLSPPIWIGLQNYINMFQDPRWLSAVRVTLEYVFLSVPLKIICALLLALLMKGGLRAIGLYRAIYYVPSLLGGSVAIAILWRQLFDTNGVVNTVLGFVFGIRNLGNWIGTPNLALMTLVILSVWQFGSPMIIFLAGLKQIPAEYYEAAATDGAGKVHVFFRITLPLITPLIFFNMILQMVGAFQAFTPAFIVSNGSGGPLDSTLFYTLYIYQEGFGYLHMGYASAMAWVLMAAIALFTAIAFLTSRYWVFYQGGEAQ